MSDPIEDFLRADLRTRLTMVQQPGAATAIRGHLGDAAFAEYLRLLPRVAPKSAHLSAGQRQPLLFIPGVMGSLLISRKKGGMWWLDVRTRQHLDDLALEPGGQSDADAHNDIVPITTDPDYEPFLTALIADGRFDHQVLAYDWRKSLRLSAERLKEAVLQTAQSSGAKVNLVAHSMGGLLVRTALMLHGRQLWPKLGRIVFVGTPHHGACAIAGYLKNHLWGFEVLAALGLYLSRATFRSLWGVLELLPAPRGVYPGTRAGAAAWSSGEADDPYPHPCLNFDPYDALAWQLDIDAEARGRLQTVLDNAAGLHRELHAAHRKLSYEQLGSMLMIAGVGQTTLFRLAYEPGFLGLWEKTRKETGRIPGDPHRDGDARVPLASAQLDGVHTRYVKGVHGGLTNIPAVYHDVLAWLDGKPLQLPQSAAGALSPHLAATDERSEAPQLDGSASGEAGLWTLDPDPAQLAALRSRVEQESPAWFNRARIL